MLVPFLAAIAHDLAALVVAPAISIPVWDQYVDLVRWALDGLAQYFHSGGLAIIAFTIIVKTLLLPLTVQSIRSSKAMQELQPKIKELQKKHGKDRQRLTQETMRLYQANRVNPMAGCLPMLLQLPIFLGLYLGIQSLSQGQDGASQFWSGPFLWLSDGLASPDPLHILPILAAVFQFVQTRMMRPYKQGKITDPQQAMMNQVMNIMPLTVILFGWNFAAGPVLYWATQSVYSVVQQWFITGWGALRDWVEWLPELPEHRRLGYRPPRADDDVIVSGEDGAPLPQRGVMGWFQKRMEDAQRQAMARRGEPAPADGEPAQDGAAAEASTGTGSVRVTGSRNGARPGSRNGGRRGRSAKGAKPAPADPAAAGSNGQEERPAGSSRAVVIPRKTRSAPSDDGTASG